MAEETVTGDLPALYTRPLSMLTVVEQQQGPLTVFLKSPMKEAPGGGHWSIWYQIRVAEAADSLTR